MNSTIPLLEIRDASKDYFFQAGAKLKVLEYINFKIDSTESGHLTTILSPFSAGKTTLLKIIGALETSSTGSIILNGEELRSPDGRVVFIPQKPSSYPWLNVEENIRITLNSVGKTFDNSLVDEIISLVGLESYPKHIPHNKSRGFRFRIALGRALAVDPVVILLDDCFSGMERETRNELQNLVNELKINRKLCFLLTTSDVLEAILLSDRILYMSKNPGRIFGEMIIDRQKIDPSAEKRDAYITAVKNEIEQVFAKENIVKTINFSD